MVGTADLSRHRGRPRSDRRRPGHLLHDRAGRRKAPRVVADHLGRPTPLARVRGRVRPAERGATDLFRRGSAHRDAREDHDDAHLPVRVHRGYGAAARHGQGRGDEAGRRTDRRHPCHRYRVLIASRSRDVRDRQLRAQCSEKGTSTMKLTTTTQVSVDGVMQGPGAPVAGVAELKARPGGELQVHGSGALFPWLLDNELADEMTLFTFPVVVGQGTRLFPDTGRDRALELVDSRATPSGVTIQVYRPAGRPQYAT